MGSRGQAPAHQMYRSKPVDVLRLRQGLSSPSTDRSSIQQAGGNRPEREDGQQRQGAKSTSANVRGGRWRLGEGLKRHHQRLMPQAGTRL
eukprot:jgi/Botrbrau1/23435/Bobra.0874s0001.1